MTNVRAFLPVRDSMGYTSALRAATGGKGFPQMTFDHWDVVPGDVHDDTTLAGQVVKETRERKKLDGGIPPLDRYFDKL